MSLPTLANLITSLCTFETKGQVASKNFNFLSSASFSTDAEIPCAEKMVMPSSGISDNSSTNTAPLDLRSSTTFLLWTTSCLT